MLFQNLKAIGEELSEICVLFCKYIYIFIYIDWFFSVLPTAVLYRQSCQLLLTTVIDTHCMHHTRSTDTEVVNFVAL
jgi:hypothetical protein